MLVLEERTLPMPELPDIVVYLEALQSRVVGERLERLRIASPFLLRSVEPRPEELAGRVVRRLARLGKRIVFGLDDDYFVILHLMIAGRLRWTRPGAPMPGRLGLAAFDFPAGTLLLTEAEQTPRLAVSRPRRGGPRRPRPRRHRRARGRPRRVPSDAHARVPHPQARPYRSAPVFRHRERVRGRGPARGEAVTAQADHPAPRSGGRRTPPRYARHVGHLDRTLAQSEGGRLPRGSHGVPRGDGSAWPLPPAVSGVRVAGSADPLRRKRGELLRDVSDRRAGGPRPGPVGRAAGGVAAGACGGGSAGSLAREPARGARCAWL